jgi:hypothetical protein
VVVGGVVVGGVVVGGVVVGGVVVGGVVVGGTGSATAGAAARPVSMTARRLARAARGSDMTGRPYRRFQGGSVAVSAGRGRI